MSDNAFVTGDKITLEMVGDGWKAMLSPQSGGHVAPSLSPTFSSPEDALKALRAAAAQIKR